MLRADRNTAMLAGLLCAGRTIKGLGYMEPLKGKGDNVLTAKDFDFYNRPEAPEEKELTVDDFMKVLSRKG